MLTTAEKIKILASREKISISKLAEITQQSRQNLTNKLTRNNFSELELRQIAKAVNAKLEITFVSKDGDVL